MTYWLLLLLALASAPVEPPDGIEIRLDPAVRGERPEVLATLTIERLGGRERLEPVAPEIREWPVGVESMILDLGDESVWRLQIEGRGIWAPEALVDLLGEDDPSVVVLPVYRTVPIRFTPRLPGNVELPDDGG